MCDVVEGLLYRDFENADDTMIQHLGMRALKLVAKEVKADKKEVFAKVRGG